jgi:hypothetical protein
MSHKPVTFAVFLVKARPDVLVYFYLNLFKKIMQLTLNLIVKLEVGMILDKIQVAKCSLILGKWMRISSIKLRIATCRSPTTLSNNRIK